MYRDSGEMRREEDVRAKVDDYPSRPRQAYVEDQMRFDERRQPNRTHDDRGMGLAGGAPRGGGGVSGMGPHASNQVPPPPVRSGQGFGRYNRDRGHYHRRNENPEGGEIYTNAKKVYVGGLSRRLREPEVREAFEKMGHIVSFEYKGDFAFVEYDKAQDANYVIDRMNGQFLGDRRINVSKFRYKGGDVRYRRTVTIDQPSGAYRLVVIGIPNDTVALELQSWVRSKGVEGLVHCSVYQRHSQREGLLEFNRRIDYDNAIRNLDGNVIFGSKVSVRDEHEWVRQKREQGPLGGAPRRGVPRDRPRMDGGFRDNPRSSYNNGYGNNNNNNNYRDDPHRRRRDYPPRDDGHYPRRRSPPPDNRRFDDRPSTMSGGGAPRFDDRDGGIRAPPAPLPPPPTMPGSEPPRYHNNHDHNRAVDPSGHPPPLPPPPSHHGHRGPDDGAVIADQGSRGGRIDRYRDDAHHSSHHPPPYRDRELVVELTHSGTAASTTSTTTVGSGASVGGGGGAPLPPPRDGYDDYNRGRQRERDPVTIEKREPPVIRDFQDEAPPIREDEKEYFTAHNEDDRLQRRRERFMDNGSNNNNNDRRRDFSRSRSRDRRRPLPPDHRDGPGMVDDRAPRYHRDRFYDEVSSGGSSATVVSSAAVAPPPVSNDQLPPVSSSSLDKTNNVGLPATLDRPPTPVRSTNPDNGNVDYPPE